MFCAGWDEWLEMDGRREGGLTLIEIAVVLAVVVVLSGIAAIAVTGSGTKARGATKAADAREVQKAVNAYHGMHPLEKWPTSGKRVGSQTIEAGNLPLMPFAATDPATFVAVDWSATFTTTHEGAMAFVPAFLRRVPKHALDTTEDADNNGIPDQLAPTSVWVLDKDGVVNVLLSDGDY